MAHHARHLAAANPGIGNRVKVLHGKVEEVEVPEKVRGSTCGPGAQPRELRCRWKSWQRRAARKRPGLPAWAAGARRVAGRARSLACMPAGLAA